MQRNDTSSGKTVFISAVGVRLAYESPAHRNAGMTSLAKRRMDFRISAWGMPPKLKVVVSVSK
jgi:hypothetical protein